MYCTASTATVYFVAYHAGRHRRAWFFNGVVQWEFESDIIHAFANETGAHMCNILCVSIYGMPGMCLGL